MIRKLGQQPITADLKILRVLLGKVGLAQPFGWVNFGNFDVLGLNISASSANVYMGTLPRACTVRTWHQAINIISPNDGSNYWTVRLNRLSDAGNVASFNTSALSAATWLSVATTSIDYAYDASKLALVIKVIKTGSPGNLHLPGPAVFVT